MIGELGVSEVVGDSEEITSKSGVGRIVSSGHSKGSGDVFKPAGGGGWVSLWVGEASLTGLGKNPLMVLG